ncbi:hypothetical protein Taro_027187, partial [Colocasia esculenta]|nr:hypothetical protein [Colocasia esculenta]
MKHIEINHIEGQKSLLFCSDELGGGLWPFQEWTARSLDAHLDLGVKALTPSSCLCRNTDRTQMKRGDKMAFQTVGDSSPMVGVAYFRNSGLCNACRSEKLASTLLDVGISVGVHGVDAYTTQ